VSTKWQNLNVTATVYSRAGWESGVEATLVMKQAHTHRHIHIHIHIHMASRRRSS